MAAIFEETTETLWARKSPEDDALIAFDSLPEVARRYFAHSLEDTARGFRRVRLQMHGEIRLKGTWRPFEATQVIHVPHGLIWQARTRLGLVSVTGSDRYIDGQGAMRWKLAGLIPLVNEGPSEDISRSTAGRLHAESIWLPSSLLRREAGAHFEPQADAPNELDVTLETYGHRSTMTMHLDRSGAPLRLEMQRWGDARGDGFGYYPFGAHIEEETTFQGCTIPTRLRVGWFVTPDGFADEGEFWRATVTEARFG